MNSKQLKKSKFCFWILSKILKKAGHISLIGDFEELYSEIAAEKGVLAASLWYWKEMIKLLPHYIFNIIYWRIAMLRNYLKVALRNFSKHKSYYLINITGLIIGVVCFVLIGLFVLDELSYDQYHDNSGQIYRVGVNILVKNTEFHAVTTCAPMSKTLTKEFPEVIASTRLRRFGSPAVRYQNKVFSEERWYYADATFFNVFIVPFIKGDPATALNKPNDVVITRSMAKKYFGSDEPLGKTLNIDNNKDFIVSGVIEDVPVNSHVHYDFLVSLDGVKDSFNQNWISNNYHTYFVLKKGVAVKEFESKLGTLIKKYVGPQVQQVYGVTGEQFLGAGEHFFYFIQSLTDIHLHSHLHFEHESNNDVVYVYIFTIIAFAILLIACINFINLSTARSADRSKEVGIRKTIGSSSAQLFRQFMTESMLMSILAFIVAIPVIHLILPLFNTFTGKELYIPYFKNIFTIPLLIGIAITIGSIAGIYPALYLASFNAAVVLKGGSVRSSKNSWLRNTLVVFQFTVSTILIIGTFIVYKQLNFIQNKKLGFNREQVVIIKKAVNLGSQILPFKQDLVNNPGVFHITNSSNLMGDFLGDQIFKLVDQPDNENRVFNRFWTDKGFVETYDIKIKDGRFFSSDQQDENQNIIINQAAVEELQLSNPIGQKLVANREREYTIIGTVENFHFESLHKKIKPLIIHSLGNQGYGKYVSVRIAAEDIKETLTFLKKTWQKYATSQSFEYEFFDDHFAEIFLAEQKVGQVFFIFSLFAILIASLGLFGLAAFITVQRTKEIGIRKTLGASAEKIVIMLYKQFTKWVLIANLIAWPVAYFSMKKWLQNFAYRTEIEIWTFFLSALIAIIIALLTVSYQSIKVAKTNLVDSLKYE